LGAGGRLRPREAKFSSGVSMVEMGDMRNERLESRNKRQETRYQTKGK
jgi:hypothetical protein